MEDHRHNKWLRPPPQRLNLACSSNLGLATQRQEASQFAPCESPPAVHPERAYELSLETLLSKEERYKGLVQSVRLHEARFLGLLQNANLQDMATARLVEATSLLYAVSRTGIWKVGLRGNTNDLAFGSLAWILFALLDRWTYFEIYSWLDEDLPLAAVEWQDRRLRERGFMGVQLAEPSIFAQEWWVGLVIGTECVARRRKEDDARSRASAARVLVWSLKKVFGWHAIDGMLITAYETRNEPKKADRYLFWTRGFDGDLLGDKTVRWESKGVGQGGWVEAA